MSRHRGHCRDARHPGERTRCGNFRHAGRFRHRRHSGDATVTAAGIDPDQTQQILVTLKKPLALLDTLANRDIRDTLGTLDTFDNANALETL